MTTIPDLSFLKRLAIEATGNGPGKWAANVSLMSWFRSDPVAVMTALEAAVNVSLRPGGLHNTKLHQAIRNLPAIAKDEK